MMPSLASPVLASGLKLGFDHSSEPGLIICGVLLVLSVVIWSLMISKLWMISRSRKANGVFLRAFHNSPHPLAVFQAREHHERSPLYHIYHTASRELAFHLLGTEEPDGTFASRLNSAGRIMPSQMSAVVTAMERAAEEASLRLESKTSVVTTVLGGAPFLGLLGTVWGLMDAFSSATGSADGGNVTAAMAPGLCAALLPLLIGLLVSVPGTFACNLVVGKIRSLVARDEHFASEFSSVLDRHFVDHRAMPDDLPSIGSLGAPNMPAFGSARTHPTPKAGAELASTKA